MTPWIHVATSRTRKTTAHDGILPTNALPLRFHIEIFVRPARAGNTAARCISDSTPPDHPRAGGEHRSTLTRPILPVGPSPRGRGTREHGAQVLPVGRIIPARAGNTDAIPSAPCRCTDHPRAGGEHAGQPGEAAGEGGSSPRGRGTQRQVRGQGPLRRIIPARAGNTYAFSQYGCVSSDHPRAGGEHRRPISPSVALYPSSPRGRGTPSAQSAHVCLGRIIPARAGNTPPGACGGGPSSDHPRAGGEHNVSETGPEGVDGSSPRGRGTRFARPGHDPVRRIIPARAGNTPPAACPGQDGADHPRAGGEHNLAKNLGWKFAGSSPRGRGTQSRHLRFRLPDRIIPARAGNT